MRLISDKTLQKKKYETINKPWERCGNSGRRVTKKDRPGGSGGERERERYTEREGERERENERERQRKRWLRDFPESV